MEKIYSILTRKSFDSNQTDQYIPKNYILFLVNNIITQFADSISNTKTVLVWLMNSLGVPFFLTSLLVPIRESGSMLPQAFIKNYVISQPKRKSIWVIGGYIQAIGLIIIGLMSLYVSGTILGWCIIFCIAIISFGRSLCSLSSKDIIGRTIPKNQRGSLTGYAQGFSGLIILISGLYFQFFDVSHSFLPWVIIGAGVLWLVAIYVYYYVYEPFIDDSKRVSKTSSFWNILFRDTLLQKFILARGLLLCSALTTPFYVILLQESSFNNVSILAIVIIVTGVAGIVSAPLWGHMADRSSRKVMSYAGGSSALIACLVTVIILMDISLPPVIFYIIIIFLVHVAHNGVRIGRKTYIVNITEGDQRIDYVSTSNTVIAILLLVIGIITSALSLISIPFALLVLGGMGLAGSYLSYKLPDAGELIK